MPVHSPHLAAARATAAPALRKKPAPTPPPSPSPSRPRLPTSWDPTLFLARSLSSRLSTRIDTRATRADYWRVWWLDFLTCLPVCLSVCLLCLLALSLSHFLTLPPASSQPTNSITALSSCSDCCLHLPHPLTLTRHPRPGPTLAHILPCPRACPPTPVGCTTRTRFNCSPARSSLCRLVSRIGIPPTASLLTGQSALPCLVLLLLQQHRHACMPLRAPVH